MLRGRNWKGVYRSDTDNLLEDFYVPALLESVSYDRAVGFFSATMLSYAAQGISALVENGGSMRLVFGGEVDEADAAAISEGYQLKSLVDRLGQQILGEIDQLADRLANQRLQTLSWMIATGVLEIKVALKRRGMYHEKIGIFCDSTGEQLVFQGSANETTYALLPDFNFESINVFPSWRQELSDHFQPYVDGFERLWKNQTKDTLVVDFPEAARERLVKIAAKMSHPPRMQIELDVWNQLCRKERKADSSDEDNPQVPVSFKGGGFVLKDHQRCALEAWRSHDLHGVLAMATGSGKTVTSIYGLVRIFESLKRLFIVVAVPYQALADQWLDELRIFNINAIPCYESVGNWSERMTNAVTLFEVGALKFCACVVVNRTLVSQAFQDRLARVPGGSLAFIGDECHHHGAEGLNKALPAHAKIRLGLSATPKHYFDEERTASLVSYYGQVVYEYDLRAALQDKVLTPYNYFVHFVELSEGEAEQYLELSSKISQLAASGGVSSDGEEPSNDALRLLLFKRARLLGNAENKLRVLETLLEESSPSPFHLFYCGDGISDDDEDLLARQVDQVSHALFQHGWRVSHFTSRESKDARKGILENFRIGEIDGLVAIRCLDEGIDVPDCRVAYILASSRNPKQFIQRRGRILRRAPNKEIATIHDFLVSLPSISGASDSVGRQLFVNELTRISEFGSLASNRSDVYESLRHLLEAFDAQHFFA